MRIRVPEPCRLHDEVHAAGSGLPVWLVSVLDSFAWVRGCPLSPIRHSQASPRTVVNPGERGSALLESVLGATPQEFESPILRHADQGKHRSAVPAGWRFESRWSHLLVSVLSARHHLHQDSPQLFCQVTGVADPP